METSAGPGGRRADTMVCHLQGCPTYGCSGCPQETDRKLPVPTGLAVAVLQDCANLLELDLDVAADPPGAAAFIEILRATARELELARRSPGDVLWDPEWSRVFEGLFWFHHRVSPVHRLRVDYLLHALWWGHVGAILYQHGWRHCLQIAQWRREVSNEVSNDVSRSS